MFNVKRNPVLAGIVIALVPISILPLYEAVYKQERLISLRKKCPEAVLEIGA
ncbi:MAG: hypothetical protein ACE3JP_15145 [Ectobacillus sp.]